MKNRFSVNLNDLVITISIMMVLPVVVAAVPEVVLKVVPGCIRQKTFMACAA